VEEAADALAASWGFHKPATFYDIPSFNGVSHAWRVLDTIRRCLIEKSKAGGIADHWRRAA
jgi:hypothetical protein